MQYKHRTSPIKIGLIITLAVGVVILAIWAFI
jgi:hypothetical protein